MINVGSAKSFITRRLSLALITGLIGLLAGNASASTPTDGETPLGLQPGAPAGSYALSDLDHINLYNGNLNFTLPLMHIGGRGGAQMTMNLTPLELKWRVLQLYFDIPPNPPYYSYILLPPGVWNPIQPGYGPGVLLGRRAATDGECGIGFSPQIRYTLTRLTFIAPDGTEHELRDQSTQGKPADLGTAVCFGGGSNFGRGKVFVTADGSAMTFLSDAAIADHITYGEVFNPTGYLFLRDGTRFRVEAGLIKSLTDRNGNVLSFIYDQYNRVSVITDSINRTVNVAYGDLVNGGFDSITWKGSRGTPRTLKVWGGALINNFRVGTAQGSSTYTQQTYHQLFPGIPNTGDNLFDWSVISAVELPDGRRYHFYYNSYAELARVELPTGGAYEYDRTPTDGVLNSPNTGYNVYRRVTERRSYADGLTLENKTTYAVDASSGNTSVDVNQRDGSGNLLAHDKHYFSDSAEHSFDLKAVCYPSYLAGTEYLTESYDLGGNVVRKLEQTFAQRAALPWWSTWTGPSGGGEPPNDTRLTDRTTTLADVTPNLVSLQTLKYDQFNNVKDICDYDYGPGAASALLRHTHTFFLTTNPVNNVDYTAIDSTTPTNSIHLRNLPSTQIVNTACGDNQTVLAETDYEYDNYTSEGGANPNHAALTPRSNISSHDAAFSDIRLTRGNITSVKKWIDSTTSTSTYQQYDVAGNVVKCKDPLGKTTQLDFADRFGIPDDNEAQANSAPSDLNGQTSFGFVTKVTDALSHTAYTQYDYYMGKPVNAQDINQVVASAYYEDAANKLDRPAKLISAANFTATRTQTVFTYDDAGRTITTAGDLTTFGDGQLASAIIYDGLGRTTETRKYEPGGGYIRTTQSYDGMGRASTVSNPFRSVTEDTYGVSVTSYDTLSRMVTIATSDKNGASTGVVSTAYVGNQVTVTDQALKKRRSVTDGLGRLIRVDEPDSNGNLDNSANPPQPLQPTYYAYDVLSNLTLTTQGSQTRRFAYDKLSRLIFAANPEQNTSTDPLFTYNSQQWALRYEYDAASNLTSKTDTRKPANMFVKVTYVYDDLHRVISRSYTDGTPAVTYGYDTATNGVGRLASVSASGVSTTSYAAYDSLGRLLDYNQQTAGQTYAMHGAYNCAGLMTSETYPSGRQVITEYDSAGRAGGVRSAAVYYAGATASDATNRIQYSPTGAITKMKIGNGLWEHTDFNSRLQPKLIGLGTSSTDSGTLKLEYDYGTTSNNGDVLSQKITSPTGSGTLLLTQTYGYDKLNRLQTANEKVNQEINPRWTQTFTFDRWGNRTGLVNTGELPTASQLTVDPATNRLAALSYDFAGNQLTDQSSHPLNYDAENRQKSLANGAITYNYSYDGGGRRVKRDYNDGTAHTTVFVYNASGQLIAEYNSDPAPPIQGGGGTSYLTTDHLGSTRVVTNSTGAVKARHDYLPFGEDVGSNVGSRSTVVGYDLQDGLRQKFTQKERDSESGLDYFLARYYSNSQGRFASVDPSRQSARLTDPQAWNRYSYALNNPLAYVDTNGKWPTWIHDLIIQRALPGLPGIQLNQIRLGSYSVDNVLNGGQSLAAVNEHSMRSPGQSVEAASENSRIFIQQNQERARKLQAKWELMGNSTIALEALFAFGRAFHTISDATSPAHEGYQVWTGSTHIRASIDHMNREANIASYRLGLSVAATVKSFQDTFGAELTLRATGGLRPDQFGSEADPTVRAIHAQYGLPGSDPNREAEDLYDYRRGLLEGFHHYWGTSSRTGVF